MHQIDPNRIGLLGISQAGWINPLAASLSDEIAFYINISGPAVSVGEEGRFSSFTNNGNSASLTDIASYNESMLSVSPSGCNPLPILADLHSPALWIFGTRRSKRAHCEKRPEFREIARRGPRQYHRSGLRRYRP